MQLQPQDTSRWLEFATAGGVTLIDDFRATACRVNFLAMRLQTTDLPAGKVGSPEYCAYPSALLKRTFGAHNSHVESKEINLGKPPTTMLLALTNTTRNQLQKGLAPIQTCVGKNTQITMILLRGLCALGSELPCRHSVKTVPDQSNDQSLIPLQSIHTHTLLVLSTQRQDCTRATTNR